MLALEGGGLVTGLNGQDRANLVKIATEEVRDIGGWIISLTCDSPSSNIFVYASCSWSQLNSSPCSPFFAKATGTPLLPPWLKTSSLGFYCALDSLHNIYEDLVLTGHMKYVLTYKLSEDFLELFLVPSDLTLAPTTILLPPHSLKMLSNINLCEIWRYITPAHILKTLTCWLLYHTASRWVRHIMSQVMMTSWKMWIWICTVMALANSRQLCSDT